MMLGYYLDLARRSLGRNKGLTVLMIVAIAFGVGASMTTLTVLHVLSSDPLPGKSHQVFHVQLDPTKASGAQSPGRDANEPPLQLTRTDGENLLRAAKADRQVLMTGGNAAIEPETAGLKPFFVDLRYTSVDFFAMFRVPFAAGTAWSPDDDTHEANVVVISKALSQKLFGGIDAIGKSVKLAGNELRVVGVVGDWRMTPHFYDLTTDQFGTGEQLWLPYSTSRKLKLHPSGSMNCWGETEDPEALGAPCEYLQYWVELDSPEKAAAYRDFLVAYSREQKAAGRFERDPNVKLLDVMQWLDYRDVVPDDVTLQSWIAIGFLVVCLVNTIGLLLTKFLRRSSEIGVRRALGASKRSIFIQLLVESGVIGLVGGVLGLGLAWLGLWAVRHQPVNYADLARLDTKMLAATFGLAVATSVLAGLFPAWRGCQVTPAIQLKSH